MATNNLTGYSKTSDAPRADQSFDLTSVRNFLQLRSVSHFDRKE